MANSTVCQSKWKPIAEPRRAKPDISSSPNPLVKVLRRGRQWVWGPNRRRAIKEWSIAINNDWVDNYACSLQHNIQTIANSFIMVNKLSELLRKVRFSYNFSKSVH